MITSRHWKGGERGCDSMATVGFTLLLLKILNHVPSIEWTIAVVLFVAGMAGSFICAVMASVAEAREQETT